MEVILQLYCGYYTFTDSRSDTCQKINRQNNCMNHGGNPPFVGLYGGFCTSIDSRLDTCPTINTQNGCMNHAFVGLYCDTCQTINRQN